MGNCQQNDKLQTIDVFHIPERELQNFSPAEKGVYVYPTRQIQISLLSQDIAQTIHGIQFAQRKYLLKTASSLAAALINVQAHQYASESFLSSLNQFVVKHAIVDELNVDRFMYVAEQEGRKLTMALRAYESAKDTALLHSFWEVQTHLLVNKISSENLLTIQKFVCIERPDNQQFPKTNTFVLFFEPVTASLKEIIEGRRKLKREWSFPEFAQLCKNLLKGLLDLHKAGFIHNDIRPSSIYYSSDKMCYLIGNFSNLMRREEENLKITFKNSNHYRDHVHLHGKKGDSQSTREETSVCDSLDVYALGITLLSAFYLCQPIDRKKCSPLNRMLVQKYPIMKILMDMVRRPHQRKPVAEIYNDLLALQAMQEGKRQRHLLPTFIIQLPQEISDINKRHIKNSYCSLGMLPEWKRALKDEYLGKQHHLNDIQKVAVFKQLGEFHKLTKAEKKASQWFHHAATTYSKMGDNSLEEHDNRRAYCYFSEGVKCSLKQGADTNTTFIKNLLGMFLARGNIGESRVSPQHLAQIHSMIKSHKRSANHHNDMFDCSLRLAEIYQFSDNFDMCEQVLVEELGFLHLLSWQQKINLHIKLAQMYIHKSQEPIFDSSFQEEQLNLAEQYLTLAHEINELGDLFQTPESIKVSKLWAELSIKRRKIKHGQMLCHQLISRITLLKSRQEISPHQKHEFQLVEGSIYSLLANCFQASKKPFEALKMYQIALKIYKKAYGSIYRKECALMLEKIGNLYLKRNEFTASFDILELASTILANQSSCSQKCYRRICNQLKWSEINSMQNLAEKGCSDIGNISVSMSFKSDNESISSSSNNSFPSFVSDL